MNSSSGKYALVKKSDSRFYSFYLSKQNKVICDYYEGNKLTKSSTVIDKNILDFSVDIDKNDRIHILCLTKEGKLLYNVLVNDSMSSYILTKLDVKSNKYKHLTLKIIKNSTHIFYGVSNLLNSNLWTLIHVYSNNKKWNKTKIISITPGKFTNPFYVDFDNLGNIHIIYENTCKGIQHIYYTSFNTFLQKWIRTPQKVSSSNSNSNNLNPYLFVDKNNTIHVAWDSLVESTHQIIYKNMPSISNTKCGWKDYTLPQSLNNNSHPVLFEDNRVLKLLFRQDNLLKCFYSSDYGYTWNSDNSIDDKSFNELKLMNFSNNLTYDNIKLKINHTYGIAKDKIILPYSRLCEERNNNIHTESKENLEDVLKKDNTIIKNNSVKSNNKIHYSIDEDKSSINMNSKIEYYEDLSNTQQQNLSLNEQINLKNDDKIKVFIENTKSSLDNLFSKNNILKNSTEEIEKILLSNIKVLDKKFKADKDSIEQIKTILSSIEKSLIKYNTESSNLHQLLSSIEELYAYNIDQIEKIEPKIHEVNTLLRHSLKPNIWNKILNLFK